MRAALCARDALYFRVSSDRQTTEKQFDELLAVAHKENTDRDWDRIRADLGHSIITDTRITRRGITRTIYRVDTAIAERLAKECIYVEQGRSSKRGAQKRPLFERMKRDAAQRRFTRLLVWKVSRLGRDMREVISTVYELGDLGEVANRHWLPVLRPAQPTSRFEIRAHNLLAATGGYFDPVLRKYSVRALCSHLL